MKIASLIIKLVTIINVIITFTIAQPSIARSSHGSLMVNYKIYIGGGLTGSSGDFTNDFFSIDLSKSFSTSSPADIPYAMRSSIPIMSADHTLVYGKSDGGGVVYLLGGHRNPPEGNPIYGYVEDGWRSITPKVRDGVIIPVNSTTRISGITDNNSNNIYIFDNKTMFIYDVWNNFWDVGNQSPFRLENYAAVMLNTSEIAYIGGSDGISNVPMSQILLYNTKSSLWYTKIAEATDGEIPLPRQGHSAAIAPDGRIFIYGGYDGNVTGSTPIFTVLEYTNGKFEWSSPQLFNPSYVKRILHTSHILENYLIITFGQNLTGSRLNTIELIDISNRNNYTIVGKFVPQSLIFKNNIIIIVGSIFGSIGCLITIGYCYYLIRSHQKKRSIVPYVN